MLCTVCVNLAISQFVWDQELVFGYSPLPAIPPFGTGIADYKGGAGKKAVSPSLVLLVSPVQGRLEQPLFPLCPLAIGACSQQHQESV